MKEFERLFDLWQQSIDARKSFLEHHQKVMNISKKIIAVLFSNCLILLAFVFYLLWCNFDLQRQIDMEEKLNESRRRISAEQSAEIFMLREKVKEQKHVQP